MKASSLSIRPLSKDDDLVCLTDLIRLAYKSLLDKGFRYWGTYQSVEDTERRFSSSLGFIAEMNGKIVGTISLKENHKGHEETPWYDKEEVCYFSQFAVLPEYQKTGLGSEMMNFIENKAIEMNYKEIALDTCEDAQGLIKYYEKRGYRFIEHIQWDPEYVNYRSVVMSKKL